MAGDDVAKAVFGLLFASSTEALFIVDRETGCIVSSNVRLAELLAYPLDGFVGREVMFLVHDHDRDISSPGRYEDVALQRSDDWPVTVELECIWVDDEVYGRLAAYMARDTGERRMLERELVAKHSALFAAYAELETAKKALEGKGREVALLAMRAGVGEVVAGIAHHLNNPVGALASTIRRLTTEVGYLPPEHRPVLERLLDRAGGVTRRIESNVNAIVRASATPAARDPSLELPAEVATALATFVGRLDDIPTKDPS